MSRGTPPTSGAFSPTIEDDHPSPPVSRDGAAKRLLASEMVAFTRSLSASPPPDGIMKVVSPAIAPRHLMARTAAPESPPAGPSPPAMGSSPSSVEWRTVRHSKVKTLVEVVEEARAALKFKAITYFVPSDSYFPAIRAGDKNIFTISTGIRIISSPKLVREVPRTSHRGHRELTASGVYTGGHFIREIKATEVHVIEAPSLAIVFPLPSHKNIPSSVDRLFGIVFKTPDGIWRSERAVSFSKKTVIGRSDSDESGWRGEYRLAILRRSGDAFSFDVDRLPMHEKMSYFELNAAGGLEEKYNWRKDCSPDHISKIFADNKLNVDELRSLAGEIDLSPAPVSVSDIDTVHDLVAASGAGGGAAGGGGGGAAPRRRGRPSKADQFIKWSKEADGMAKILKVMAGEKSIREDTMLRDLLAKRVEEFHQGINKLLSG